MMMTMMMLDCSITSLYHVTKSTGATFFVIQEYLVVRFRGRRRCIKECATAVAQVTWALLNATRLGWQHIPRLCICIARLNAPGTEFPFWNPILKTSLFVGTVPLMVQLAKVSAWEGSSNFLTLQSNYYDIQKYLMLPIDFLIIKICSSLICIRAAI